VPEVNTPTPAALRARIGHVPTTAERKERKDKRARYRSRRAERRRAAILSAGARYSYAHKGKRLSIIAPDGRQVHHDGKHIASLSVAQWTALIEHANAELGLSIEVTEEP
jgi:hypothetical protein